MVNKRGIGEFVKNLPNGGGAKQIGGGNFDKRQQFAEEKYDNNATYTSCIQQRNIFQIESENFFEAKWSRLN